MLVWAPEWKMFREVHRPLEETHAIRSLTVSVALVRACYWQLTTVRNREMGTP